MSARDRILGRLRTASQSPPPAPPDVAAYYREHRNGESVLERFIANARGWQAQVLETTPSRWPQDLLSLIEDKKLKRPMAGRGTELSAALAAAVPQLAWYDAPLASFKSELFEQVDAGITGALGGIAETGTLMLWPGVNEPRTLSLVPPIHIAVLRASRVYATWHEVVQAQAWAEHMPTNAVLVTGPSKTADIQRMLVYGAHGPRELHILLIRDESAT